MVPRECYTFSLQAIAAALVKRQDLHAGLWQLGFTFGIGAMRIPSDDPVCPLAPAAVVPLLQVDLSRMDTPTALTVDAAAVNPVAERCLANHTRGKGRKR